MYLLVWGHLKLKCHSSWDMHDTVTSQSQNYPTSSLFFLLNVTSFCIWFLLNLVILSWNHDFERCIAQIRNLKLSATNRDVMMWLKRVRVLCLLFKSICCTVGHMCKTYATLYSPGGSSVQFPSGILTKHVTHIPEI